MAESVVVDALGPAPPPGVAALGLGEEVVVVVAPPPPPRASTVTPLFLLERHVLRLRERRPAA